jgi:hypothetical protein
MPNGGFSGIFLKIFREDPAPAGEAPEIGVFGTV